MLWYIVGQTRHDVHNGVVGTAVRAPNSNLAKGFVYATHWFVRRCYVLFPNTWVVLNICVRLLNIVFQVLHVLSLLCSDVVRC